MLARYPSASAPEIESRLAMLALWALEAVEAGRLHPADADRVFTRLDMQIDEDAVGPELSDDAGQLLLEGMAFHDWGTEFSADPTRVRALAFSLLNADS